MEFIWRQPLKLHSFDFTWHGLLSPGAVCRYFGEAAGLHAADLGFGGKDLREQGLTWMLHRLQLQFVTKPPASRSVVLSTWPSDRTGRLRAERDFILTDESGNQLACGLSTWLMIHIDQRRPVRILDSLLDACVQGQPAPMSCLELPGPPSQPEWHSRPISVGWPDIDRNLHANFSRLVDWTLGSCPEIRWRTHAIRHADLKFIREALPGEELQGRSCLTGGAFAHHELHKSGGTLSVAGRTEWVPLSPE